MSIMEGVVVTVSHLLVGNYATVLVRIGLRQKLDAKDLRFVKTAYNMNIQRDEYRIISLIVTRGET